MKFLNFNFKFVIYLLQAKQKNNKFQIKIDEIEIKIDEFHIKKVSKGPSIGLQKEGQRLVLRPANYYSSCPYLNTTLLSGINAFF
jgi:hypothetical protein